MEHWFGFHSLRIAHSHGISDHKKTIIDSICGVSKQCSVGAARACTGSCRVWVVVRNSSWNTASKLLAVHESPLTGR